jgi:pSer/pThr/pTyr-binding forkhead associated (FHA) protein
VISGPEVAFLVAKCDDYKNVFALTKEFTSVGRVGRNDIKLPLGSVSRTHATFIRTPAGYKVTDAGSKHGVVVNGTRIIEKYLQEGDVVQIGDVHMKFTFKAPPDARKEKPQPAAPPPETHGDAIRALKDQLDTVSAAASKLEEQISRLREQLKDLEKKVKDA